MQFRRILYSALAGVLMLATAPGWTQVNCNDWNTREFFDAAELADVARCLVAGADPSAIGDGGVAPLHRAASNGNIDVVRALIDARADVNVLDNGESMPIHWAAWMSPNPEVAESADCGWRQYQCPQRSWQNTTVCGFLAKYERRRC